MSTSKWAIIGWKECPQLIVTSRQGWELTEIESINRWLGQVAIGVLVRLTGVSCLQVKKVVGWVSGVWGGVWWQPSTCLSSHIAEMWAYSLYIRCLALILWSHFSVFWGFHLLLICTESPFLHPLFSPSWTTLVLVEHVIWYLKTSWEMHSLRSYKFKSVDIFSTLFFRFTG